MIQMAETKGDNSEDLVVVVKWSGKEYPVSLYHRDTISDLRNKIFKLTNVLPSRQKLVNLKCQGKPANDDVKIGTLGLKSNYKVMMIGSTEKAIADVCLPPETDEVKNDLDYQTVEEKVSKAEWYVDKMNLRVREYPIKELNAPREGKPLLVLDVDYTLFDHRSSGERIEELMRPHLHTFLETVYPYYNLVIWSATSMRWIERKMNLFGVTKNPNYKIWFYLDSLACISIYVNGVHCDTKPLWVIWGKYKEYSAKNTIIIDDIERNFLMNPDSGLKIKAFRSSVRFTGKDRELLKLADYLLKIAKHCDDFETLNHKNWENYKSPEE